MRYKTLFRLLVKFLGLWIGCNGISSVVSMLANWAASTWSRPPGVTYSTPYWAYSFSGCTSVAIGLYLFFGGKWIVNLAIPGNKPYCHECGYDLTGAAGNVCNECGTPFRGDVTTTHA